MCQKKPSDRSLGIEAVQLLKKTLACTTLLLSPQADLTDRMRLYKQLLVHLTTITGESWGLAGTQNAGNLRHRVFGGTER
jgi:hypothetical protein